MQQTSSILVIVVAAMLVVLATATGQATLYQYEFGGQVTSVDLDLAGAFSVGQVVSGTFFADDEDLDPSNERGIYFTSTLVAQIGPAYSFTAPSGAINVFDKDSESQFTLAFSRLDGDTVNGSFHINRVAFRLIFRPPFLDSDVLPFSLVPPPDTIDESVIGFNNFQTLIDVKVTFVRLVPEAETFLLAVAGSIGLIVGRKWFRGFAIARI